MSCCANEMTVSAHFVRGLEFDMPNLYRGKIYGIQRLKPFFVFLVESKKSSNESKTRLIFRTRFLFPSLNLEGGYSRWKKVKKNAHFVSVIADWSWWIIDHAAGGERGKLTTIKYWTRWWRRIRIPPPSRFIYIRSWHLIFIWKLLFPLKHIKIL